jgi:hypothetical protein
MQSFVNSELEKIARTNISTRKILRYKGQEIPAEKYVWAFYQALEEFTALNTRLLDTVYSMGTVSRTHACTASVNLDMSYNIQTKDGIFNYYKDKAKFNRFLEEFHNRNKTCDFGVISLGLYEPDSTHETVIFVYKNPLSGITMTLYDPIGNVTQSTDKATSEFLEYFASSYSVKFSIPVTILPRTYISCYVGIQSIALNAGVDIGYCMMYTYLWTFIAIKSILALPARGFDLEVAKHSKVRYTNVSTVLKGVEDAILNSSLTRTPESLHNIVFNFAILVMNEHLLRLGRFQGKKELRNFEKLFQKFLKEINTN